MENHQQNIKGYFLCLSVADRTFFFKDWYWVGKQECLNEWPCANLWKALSIYLLKTLQKGYSSYKKEVWITPSSFLFQGFHLLRPLFFVSFWFTAYFCALIQNGKYKTFLNCHCIWCHSVILINTKKKFVLCSFKRLEDL